jgi:hypothetical protein
VEIESTDDGVVMVSLCKLRTKYHARHAMTVYPFVRLRGMRKVRHSVVALAKLILRLRARHLISGPSRRTVDHHNDGAEVPRVARSGGLIFTCVYSGFYKPAVKWNVNIPARA